MLKSHEVSYIDSRKKLHIYVLKNYNVVAESDGVKVERFKPFGGDLASINYIREPEKIDTENAARWRAVWNYETTS